MFWDRTNVGRGFPPYQQAIHRYRQGVGEFSSTLMLPRKESDFIGWEDCHPHYLQLPVASHVRCRKGPESGLLSNTQTNCMWRPTCWQSKGFSLERAPEGEDQQGKGPRRAALPRGFTVMESVSSCPWPIMLTQGLSWWPEHHSVQMDSSGEDSGRAAGRMGSLPLLWSSRILLTGLSLLVSAFLAWISCF